jgi:hypothetical protein
VTPGPISLDHTSDVAAAPAQVWALLADPTSRPSWMTELVAVDAEPGPVEVGDRFSGRSSILLHDFIGESTVTVADPAQVLEEQVVIGARFVSRWEVRPTGDGGSTVRHLIDVEFPHGPFSAVERRVLRRRLLRMQKTTMANLARRF